MMIPLLATLVMAAFVTTMGLLVNAAAEKYAVPAVLMSAQFFYFTGGVFLGGILAFFIYDHVTIQSAVVVSYSACILIITVLHFSTGFDLLPWLLFPLGSFLALVGCAGVMVATQHWEGRARQTLLVSQDIMFNGGGVLFSAVASWLVVRDFSWTTLYLATCLLMVTVIACALFSSFHASVAVIETDSDRGRSEWNPGIMLVGISLLLFMLAKISLFIWVPQYVEQHFDVSVVVSGQFMANVFTTAFLGSLIGTWIASRIDVKYLLLSLVAVSALSVLLFTRVDEVAFMLWLGYAYGVSVSVTFNAYMAYGLSLVKHPSHRNVVYLQLCGGLGSALAPWASSQVMVISGDISVVIQACFYTLLIVVVSLLAGSNTRSGIR